MLNPDSVSNIHKRWFFTRLNPSSPRISYIISLFCVSYILIIIDTYQNKTNQIHLIYSVLLGQSVLTAANFVDYVALHRTPLNKLSKIFHVSAFANLLWLLTIIFGVAFELILSKKGNSLNNYVIEGMLIACGFRIAIFASVFGAGFGRSVASSFIQPLILFFAFEYSFSYYHNIIIQQSVGLGFGIILVVVSIFWTIAADRAGRPKVKSTFGLLQAFLAAWTENKVERMEKIAESKAHSEVVRTYIVKFRRVNSDDVHIVLPDIHPGPFNPVGGSNLPYVLYCLFSRKALVMHSVSDHSLNIPSEIEVDKYVKSLSKRTMLEKGDTCTIPIQIKMGESTVTGIAFGNTVLVVLSMAPRGMEDVPNNIRIGIEQYSSELGFKHVLVIDSHNSMGAHLTNYDSCNLLSATRQCLEKLKSEKQYKFKIGYANSDEIQREGITIEDLGQSGLATLLLEIKQNRYLLGWADSNNMKNGIHNHIIFTLSNNGINMIEVCTSDTHATSGKRTRQGYYALGNISHPDKLSKMYLGVSKKSIDETFSANFELLLSVSKIKVMGKDQFNDYSSALDKSMNITKMFLVFIMVLFISMLITS